MSKQTELAQVADTITVNSGNVGIGTSSPLDALHVQGTIRGNVSDASNENLRLTTDGGGGFVVDVSDATVANPTWSIRTFSNEPLAFDIGGSERMRIDTSGNLIVGETSTSAVVNGTGAYIASNGQLYASSTSSHFFNRKDSNGDIATFRKNGATVGRIGCNSSSRIYIGSGDANLTFNNAGNYVFPSTSTGGGRDNLLDLGVTSARFNDAFIVNGVTTGSDGNDKQDIRDLTEAEQRVAAACKGLLKAWRWKSAVEEKGDDARIHCGIIAQDLQAAFAAEGLDAGRYAMFMSNTWWEHDVEVPAVEAVAEALDEEGNVVTEAVEAADAYTRTDTYETQEEAPEGATERTRLGVRYSELLAFIIGAL